MSTIPFDEAKKIWYGIAKYTGDKAFSFELELNKKLLDIFQAGPFYYFIFNCATARIEHTSDPVKQLLGLSTTQDFTLEYLLSVIHPQDLPYFYDFEQKVTAFFNSLPPDKILKYKVSYDYRIRRTDGSYIRILQQATTIQSDESGAVIRALDVHTDISHLNKPNGSTLSFIGLDGEPNYYDVSEGRVALPIQHHSLTKRELQVLHCLLQGMTSKQIAVKLAVSKVTVDGHRKNMLSKTGSASTVELTMKAIQQGWLKSE